MKRLSILILMALMLLMNHTSAALIEQNANVAVMDFGTHPGAVPIDINILNAGQAANEYVTFRLIESGKLNVIDRFMVEEKINAEGIKTEGLVDPDSARKIGELLGVKYIIYGNVNDVTLSNVGTSVLSTGVTVCTVQAHLIMRMMNVETGDIVMASKGEGKSKSSFVYAKGGPILTVEIGKTKVTQDSVRNVIEQSAFSAVDVLLQRLNL